MDQVKEFLRQCIKYRFWISLSVAALFSIIAYFLGSGPVKAKAAAETTAITNAEKDVKQYTQPNIPNGQYRPIVDEKTQVLTTDVNKAWKTLYGRQAPLLQWPKEVHDRFTKWGRTWPEGVADSAVEVAKDEYIVEYPKQVTQVYKSFKPFEYDTGKGIVSAPPEQALLRPATFDPAKLPDLGKIWSAQERLWIQGTVLDVIAKVNRNAKDWDTAIVKQINSLEVGNSSAQDQRSIAKGETLAEAPKIKAPGEPEEEDAGAAASPMSGMMSMMQGRKGEMGGMMGGGVAATNAESVYYVTAGEGASENAQYKILPILLSVMVDQDHVQDLLVELENSPMSIQVMDFEFQRPTSRVTKPEKGTMTNFAGYGMGGYGGMMGMMRGRMGEMGAMGGYGGMMSGYGGMYGGMMQMMRGRMGEMGGMYGMGGMQEKKGTDKRSVNREEKRKEETKNVESAKGPSFFDPYFNIVEVKVFGQARFYNPPPEEPAAEPSLGETAGDAGKQEPANGAAAPADAVKAEASKPEVEQPGTAKDAAQPEPSNAAPGADEAKGEAPKAEPAKAEAPKGADSKTDAPKS
jgi:hypothetical protein